MNWKHKYLKYKSKYLILKGGEPNRENFGFIQLDSSGKKSILTNPLFNLENETKLIDLVCKFLTPKNFDGYSWDNIGEFIFSNDYIQEIKTKLVEITGLVDIGYMLDEQFIEIIFGDLRDKKNLEKIIKYYRDDIKYNIYGFDKFVKFEHDEKEKIWGYTGYRMFLNCAIAKTLDATQYIFYYIENNYKIMMLVNKSLWEFGTICEHIYIHKLPSTILIEKIFGKNHRNMAENLHKYAIQELKPNYIVSAPLPIMIPIFNKLSESGILFEIPNPFDTSTRPDYVTEVFCTVPTRMYWVNINDNLIM